MGKSKLKSCSLITAGRGQGNIHGAVNLDTFDASFVEPMTLDGVSTAKLLAKNEVCNHFKRLIQAIWDNAAYHKGLDVRKFLATPDCHIQFIQLPPNCPHLNPIERLWTIMHQYMTHNQHHATQKQFANAFAKFFRKKIPNEWQSFQDQVSDNFRVINYDKFRILK